ncbi:MAG: dTDP-glucose 4,6-dehydratase [Chlamydiae bacterium]|nr:dTDP-glucose 4,6-dehydratase [Chlamydiota bacterium]
MTILVTGGAGFIGSNFIRYWLSKKEGIVVNLDKLTYAGDLNNLTEFQNDPRHIFVRGDIADRKIVQEILQKHHPLMIVHFAAETHVDRSIKFPQDFIQTNVVGTLNLLDEVREYFRTLKNEEKENFRFLHVSTDEVYGSLKENDDPVKESSVFAPNNPYSASKAASDHLVRAYNHTYGLPTIVTHCTNNFGPYQYPEKLIPLLIMNGVKGKPLPVYGDGLHIRNWLYVDDHSHALSLVLKKGRIGEVYNIGGPEEKTNLEIVETVGSLLDELHPHSPYKPHSSLIAHIEDRSGHDRRYSMDSSKICQELGWKPDGDFISRMRKTVKWYLDHDAWVENAMNGDNKQWFKTHYSELEIV